MVVKHHIFNIIMSLLVWSALWNVKHPSQRLTATAAAPPVDLKLLQNQSDAAGAMRLARRGWVAAMSTPR